MLIRVATSTTGWALRASAVAAAVFVWFTYVAQIFISEFFMAHPIIGWLNQPLAQLPWFHCVPVPLRNPAPEIVLTLLLLILIAAVSRLARPRQHLQPRG